MYPFISVVIPTYKRSLLLERLLRSLKMQNIPGHWFQVIVVSDGPDPQTETMVSGLIEAGQGNLKYLTLENRSGPAAARNLGWRYAQTDLIAFTDDDCIVQPSWAASFIQAWKKERLIAFTGRVEVPVSAAPTDYENNLKGLETAEFITANCCLTRQALELSGGFDEKFRLAWREDSDLHFKLLKNRIPVLKVEQARVVHPVRTAGWGISLKEQKKSLYDALLYKKFPLLYRQRIAARPPVLYYGMILAFVNGICLIRMNTENLLFMLPWGLLVLWFACKRLRHTSKSFSHIVEMVVTSALIPFLSVSWRIYGAFRFRTLFI